MPRLIYFLPCSKVIVDREDRLASLISIIERVNIHLGPETPLDDDMAIPISWTIATEWRPSPEDVDKTFEQHVELIYATGKIAYDVTVTFRMESKRHKQLINLSGLPAAVPGDLVLKLSLREATKGSRWKNISEYVIEISHQRSG